MPRAVVAMCGECDVHDSVEEQKPARLFSHFMSKSRSPPELPLPFPATVPESIDWAAKFFGTAGDVECVEALEIVAAF